VRPKSSLQVEQKVQHLRLDRLVEGRHGLVEDDEARLERERAGDVDALALTAGELVRVALGEAARLQPDPVQEVARAGDGLAARDPCTCGPNAIEASTVRRGFSDE
jgi:hypothetical protein